MKSFTLSVFGWATLAVAAPATYRVDPTASAKVTLRIQVEAIPQD